MAGLFGSKTTITNTDTKIGALRIQNSSQGLPVPIVFGKTRIPANLIWYGDFTAVPHTETTTSGGKGGGGVETQNTSYTYTVGVIFGLMEGPSANGANFIGTVWADKKVTDPVALGLSLFEGSYTQTPWSFLVSNHANEALSYRGLAYAAQSAFDLGSSDGLPNTSFEVIGLVGTSDVNPADVLDPYLTSNKFGAGWPSAQLGDLTDFRDYCAAAGFLVSPAYTAQAPASQGVAELCQVGNSAPVWSEGVLKIKPYADEPVGSYTPDLTVQYDLGYSDFLAEPGQPPVKILRKRQADAFNQVQIECLDRANQYNTTVVEGKDQWNIETYGLRPMAPITAHAICDANIGRTVAQTIMQRQLYVRNTYEFTVGWRYARLEPMDIVSLTDALTGLDQTPVRLTSIEEDENGHLAMTAEDLTVGVSTPGSYATQPSSGSTPAAAVDPGDTYAPVIFQPPLALSLTPQVWIGAQGGDEWGGAQVWVSTDGGSSYARAGAITNPARYGVLTANFPTGVDPDVTHTLSVDLTVSRGTLSGGTTSDADGLVTLSYVSGANAALQELIAYSAETLTAPNAYDLTTYIRRGQAGSSIAAHVAGAKFMRLDDAVQKFDVSPSLYGTTLYIKLLSFNKTGGGLQALSDVTPITFNLVAQAATGNGYSFIADRSTANVADPGAGKMRFNNAAQSLANQVVFDAQTNDGANMVNYFASVGSAGYMELRDLADTNKWASYTLTSSNAPAGYQVFGVTYKAGGAEIPNGDTVIVSFSPTPPTGVTSVGLSMPAAIFSVSNTPVTTTGNLTVTLIAQNAATFLAGPLTGNATAPAFRALAATDFNGGANASNTTVLYGDFVWRAPPAAGGIGNIALTMPAIFSVANSPLTANGTLAVSLANQSAGLVWAGPSSGNAAAPSFRNIVPTDLGNAVVANTFLAGPSSGANGNASMRALAGGDMPRLTVNTQTANYTLVLADANVAWIDVNSANAVVITVPSAANVSFANGVSMLLNRRGAGNLTISAQANVVVANSSSNTARAQNSTLGLFMRAPDQWVLFGDTT